MGLFEKTVVCENCGEEFSTGKLSKDKLCKWCMIMSDQASRYGYLLPKGYEIPKTEYLKASRHRDDILEKYQREDFITDEEILEACRNVHTMSMDEKKNFLIRLLGTCTNDMMGASITDKFLISNRSGMVLDFQNVFAIAFDMNGRMSSPVAEAINCIFFSNDPYVPALSFVYGVQKKWYQTHSKSGRESLKNYFSNPAICPNLKYPVMELKELKNIIKKEKKVNGNIDLKLMEKLISDASINVGVFMLDAQMGEDVKVVLYEHGYRTYTEMTEKLMLFDRKFKKEWNEVLQEAVKDMINGTASWLALD